MEKKLEVKDLRISFKTNNGTVKAVRDISFDLYKGETLCVVGESGSGKSVTARAIMGILAGNSIVENGEIIYDGKDLLKLDEETFHTLRGNRLSMIFQDPLSSLNPIVRIGKQLTEAMILNNKERRRDARAQFNGKLKLLEKTIIAAKGTEGTTHEDIKTFDAFVTAGVELEKKFDLARETAVEAIDTIDAIAIELVTNDAKKVREKFRELARVLKNIINDFVVPAGDADYAKIIDVIGRNASGYQQSDVEKAKADLEKCRAFLNAALGKPQPNFFRIGYLITHGTSEKSLKGRDVEKLNAEALEKLNDEFMLRFANDVALALRYSRDESAKKQSAAIAELRKSLEVFKTENPDLSACRAAAKTAAKEVENAIDYLSIHKDSKSYIFRTSVSSAIDKYFRSLKNNPKEEKRVAKETVKYEKAVNAHKLATAVVPPVIIDGDAARKNMAETVEQLIAQYSETRNTETDFGAQAIELIDYLKEQASNYAYTLSSGMARHRAIELMKEVGIPEPQKRYSQYPFEFSGGMRQRIVIAIALAANPDILICDEPTTALDVTIQAQILELINKLKKQRSLSVIFITHDLGVVANMADRVAVMYAGKIVEYGTADDVFYEPKHPYTWALLSSMPDLETKEKLEAIPGTPPNMILPPKGDAFAARNKYAMEIDFEEQPPLFRVSDTHYAATWLLHPDAPKVEPPAIVRERIDRMKRMEAKKDA